MINKVLFISSFFLWGAYTSFGQNCTPDPQYTNTSSQRGTHPDTVINLAPSYAGTPYSQTITIVVPPDTTIPNLGKIKWDSTALTDVSGLPPGFTYSCYNNSLNPNRCSWKGGTIGCIVITGAPLATDIGTYPLTFYTNNYLGGNKTAISYPAKGYKIVVKVSAGIHENPAAQVLQQNNPNPFNDLSEVQFTAVYNGTAQFKIYDIIGALILHYDITVKRGINKFVLNARDLDAGIYFYSIDYGTNAFTRKMIVTK